MNKLRAIWDIIRGNYEATRYSPNRTTIYGGLQHARMDMTASTREEMTRLAIYFEKNNPIVQRLSDIWECYTVGAGLQIMPASSSPDWNKRAKKWHTQWELYPDINSRQTFGTLMSLVARSWFIQGGILILFVEGAKTPGRPAYPRLQLVEGRLCATPPDLRDREGESIIDGCQVDSRGRTIGYYIADEDSKGRKIFSGPRPAESVIHVFEPSRAGQYRELSLLHAVMNELRDLDDLHVLEMIACKDAAEKSNIVTTATGELNPASMIRQRGSLTQSTVTGVDSTSDRAEFISQALGGRTIAMRTGETFNQFRNERPSVASREYWNYKTELVCNGVGIPMCMAFPNTAIQGTALRAALDMAATFFQQRFAVIADICRRIYVRNMDWARYNEPTLRDAPSDWANVIIHAPRAPNVDVGYNSAASLAELSVGACNFSMIYGPRGLDWREQMDALNEQLTYAESIGLTERLAAMNAAQKAVPDPEDQLDATAAASESADAETPEEETADTTEKT